MIRKHVDLIAIALLLSAMAMCSQTREALLLGMRSSKTVWVRPHYYGSRTLTPRLPRISFARD